MRKATLAFVFVLLTTLTAACEPRGSNDGKTGRPVHCDVIADSPRKVDGKNRIAAQVRFRCEPPGAQKLTIKLKLQKRDPNNPERWRTVSSKSYTLEGKQTRAAELKYKSREVTVRCSTGVFRTVVDWSRTSRGDKRGDNLVSGLISDPCKRLFAD